VSAREGKPSAFSVIGLDGDMPSRIQDTPEREPPEPKPNANYTDCEGGGGRLGGRTINSGSLEGGDWGRGGG